MLKEVQFPFPPAPELLALTNLSSLEITYRLRSPEPAICRIDISWERDFLADRTWSFDHLNAPGSNEATYRLPVELPEGRYFLRLSAFDGLATSQPSNISEFTIDRTAPVITLASPTEESTEDREILFSVKISEPCRLTLNDLIISTEALVALQPGANRIQLVATDEAGNTSLLTKEITSLFIPPDLTVVKPKETDWYKPGSTLFIQAKLNDPQIQIEDETEAQVIISNRLLEDRLTYDKKSGEISGFINLPENYSDGRLAASITIKDLSGNTSLGKFKINIDRTPPVLAAEPIFTNQPCRIPIPIEDAGVGVDNLGTLVVIAGVSLEGIVTAEPQKIILQPKMPLREGSYEVEVTPRDLIGNTGNALRFSLIVDTVAPDLTLFNSTESEIESPVLILQGKAEEPYLSEIKIYDNQKLVGSFTADRPSFSREAPLFAGINNILVEAYDRAGNCSRKTLRVFARVKSASALLTDYGSGPNPFSPKTDGQMFFTYKLSSAPADLKIYVFDLTGTLIWQKDLKNVNSGSTAWSGIDQFGKTASNGVYSYLIYASAGETKEIRRGKIAVLQ